MKEGVEDQPVHWPAPTMSHRFVSKHEPGVGLRPLKKLLGWVMGRQGMEGEDSQAGEVGLEIPSGTEAPRLHLSLCGWTCRVPQGCGFWRQSCLFSSCGVYGLLWFWHTVLVPASPQMHGLGNEGSLWHGGLLPKSEGCMGIVTGDFSRIPFQRRWSQSVAALQSLLLVQGS